MEEIQNEVTVKVIWGSGSNQYKLMFWNIRIVRSMIQENKRVFYCMKHFSSSLSSSIQIFKEDDKPVVTEENESECRDNSLKVSFFGSSGRTGFDAELKTQTLHLCLLSVCLTVIRRNQTFSYEDLWLYPASLKLSIQFKLGKITAVVTLDYGFDCCDTSDCLFTDL